jgi:hypothetical protein
MSDRILDAVIRSSRLQYRRGLTEAWESINPILRSGEPGFEEDTGKVKIGDGETAWTDLDYQAGEESSTPVDLGDLGATATADLDGATNVSFTGVLTADCELTIEGLSAGCHFEIWPVQDPITGGWSLSIVGGESEDPVAVTVADEVNGVSRIGGYSPDGTALYLDLAATGGESGGGSEVVVTLVTTFGSGVASADAGSDSNGIGAGARYEVADGYLRMTGFLQIARAGGFNDSFVPFITLPPECKPARDNNIYAALQSPSTGALVQYGVYVDWNANDELVELWFYDDVYSDPSTDPFQVALHGFEWRLDPAA